MKKTNTESSHQALDRFFDAVGFLGYLFTVPAILVVFGKPETAAFLERSLGSLGSPAALLLLFLLFSLLRTLFGTIHRALPPLFGMAAGLVLFSAAFDIPFMKGMQGALLRFPAFESPGPPLFAGIAAIAAGSLFGMRDRGRSLPKVLATAALSAAVLFGLSAANPFPAVDRTVLSVDNAIARIARELGKEYRNPEVEEAVRKVIEDRNSTVEEKDRLISELTERLRRSEEERQALEQAVKDTALLEEELAESRRIIEEMKNSLDDDIPLVVGGDYRKAVQANDPAVRDFAVRIASAHSGPYDNPQGSRIPSEAGLRQIVLLHAAVSSRWKYVSDPASTWSDYCSPARRTLAVGLAGDCDDFAVMIASCIGAVGGRARIVHGIDGSSGHAWAEVYLGNGQQGRKALNTLNGIVRRSGLAASTGPGDQMWLVLDWRLGEYSMRTENMTVAWTGN
jgi:transglutaminase-like putative cysteine protease